MTPPETISDEMLMAYADGELDPLNMKRVERAMAADAAVAQAVAAHRALRAQLGAAFAPVAEVPVPGALAALLTTNVVPLPQPMVAAPSRRWLGGLAIAATLIAGVALGTQWPMTPTGPVTVADGRMVAAGPLAKALDTQLASTTGDTRIVASFRAAGGSYCRVFEGAALGGIACREQGVWQLRQTRVAAARSGAAYQQAGSTDAALMAAAQEMMAGDAMDAAAERKARDAGWK